jgi:hypothetical protein
MRACAPDELSPRKLFSDAPGIWRCLIGTWPLTFLWHAERYRFSSRERPHISESLHVDAAEGGSEKCEDLKMADETSNLTPEQMAARIAELEGRLAKGGSISFKVSEKGAVSVYGLGRFPVTLYLEQWDALLSHAAELREFIEANKSRLKTKDQTKR